MHLYTNQIYRFLEPNYLRFVFISDAKFHHSVRRNLTSVLVMSINLNEEAGKIELLSLVAHLVQHLSIIGQQFFIIGG